MCPTRTACQPISHDVRADRAHTLQLQGNYAEAEAQFEQVLAAVPGHNKALANYCAMLEQRTDGLHRIEELARRALEIDPRNVSAARLLAQAWLLGLRGAEGLALLEAVLQWPDVAPRERLDLVLGYLFYLGYSDAVSPQRFAQSLNGARTWLRNYFAAASASIGPLTNVPYSANAPLSVAVLCADAYDHPVGRLLASFLPHIDPARANVTLYDVSSKEDHITQVLRSCGRYVNAKADDGTALAMRVRAGAHNLVLDTSSVTSVTVLHALALRCAPTQLTWAGWVHGHPLATVDGFIADSTTAQNEECADLGGRVYRLPYCVYAYRSLTPRPDPSPLPALRNGYVTFGAYNHLTKVTPTTLDLWAAVLHEVRDSRLAVKAASMADTATRDRLVAALAARGIPPHRLLLGLPSDYQDFLIDFGRVDMLVDCVPFNGGMTTIDGLMQGVPLLALKGATHASRVGMSLVSAAGLPDWVAPDIRSYAALAAHKSRELGALAYLRHTLARRIEKLPLGDVRTFAASITDLWCNAHGAVRSSMRSD